MSKTTASDGDSESLLDHVGFYLSRGYFNYIALVERLLDDAGLDKQLRPGMVHVLFALFDKDDQAMSALARRLQLSKSTMTGMVERLRLAKIVALRKDSRDVRAVRIRLTSVGRALQAPCLQMAGELNGVLCRRFSASEQQQFKRLLDTMIRGMREELALDPVVDGAEAV